VRCWLENFHTRAIGSWVALLGWSVSDRTALTGERRAVVVGAGIGGLACAVALRRVGWRVLVVERAPELTEVGAGLSLWSNALDALGLSDVRTRGTLQASGGLRTSRGRLLQRSSGARLQQQAGVDVLVVHRAELQREQ
jgi:2-polyprenyl-6-methoxyphenol hydroxylase-like FAD-dependent oxidoreductase